MKNIFFQAIVGVGALAIFLSALMAFRGYHSWTKFTVDTFMVALGIGICYRVKTRG